MPVFSRLCRICSGRWSIRLAGVSLILFGLFSLSGSLPTAVVATRAGAQDQAGDDGGAAAKRSAATVAYLVRVPTPIAGQADEMVERRIRRLVADLPEGAPPPIVVLQFGDEEEPSSDASEFGRAYELAKFLISPEVNGIRTVAYIPGRLEGHALLVAMACQEIVVRRDAVVGNIEGTGIDMTPVIENAYREIAQRRQTIPAVVALGLLDKQLAVYRVRTADGTRYMLAAEYERFKEDADVAIVEVDTRFIPAGELGEFDGAQLREDGFVSHLVDGRQKLPQVLRVDRLDESAAGTGAWRGVRVVLHGVITNRKATQAMRGIQDALQREQANFICVEIDSAGGSPTDTILLANYLSSLPIAEVRTVAYVPYKCRSDAALLALACQQVVMHPEATLGGDGNAVLLPHEITELTARTEAICGEQTRSWSLWGALFDPQLMVHQYTRQETGQVAYFSQQELQQQVDPDAWQKEGAVTRAGEPLKLQGARAEQLGLATLVVNDFNDLALHYNLTEALIDVEPNLALELIEVLSSPSLAYFLLFIGSFALLAELTSPGMVVGGFVAGLCFLMFFWSQFLNGSAGWLEMLLFCVGLICVLMEIFVIPGFGVFGLGGGIMIVTSLVLASQTFVLPRNSYQLEQLPYSLFSVVAAGGGLFVAGFVMRRYMATAPVLRNIMLQPPTGERGEEISRREALAEFHYLLGKQGVTTTPLAPSGKARFGNEVVSVMSDGEALPRGAGVKVTAVQGNLVMVQASEQSPAV